MTEAFREFYHAQPILAMLLLMLCTGYAAILLGIVTCVIAAILAHWREEYRARRHSLYLNLSRGPSAQPAPSAGATQEGSVDMKTRILLVALLAIAFLALQPGCGTLGNGSLDLPVEIDLVFADNFGNEFHLMAGPDGVDASGSRFISAKTGNVYAVAEDGFTITAPNGARVRIKKVE